MLTIYTTCRNSIKWPLYGILQYNAIKSWTLLKENPEIIVIGDDPGVKELCQELNVIHIPEVKLSDYGTPFLKNFIDVAQGNAKNEVMLHCSSDVILFNDTIDAAKLIKKHLNEFCGICRRSNVELEEKLDFEKGWEEIRKNTEWSHMGVGDYFLYSKGFWNKMPKEFVIGRGRCDNWMFGHAHKQHKSVELTNLVKIVHQNHPKFETGRMNKLKANPEFIKNDELLKKYNPGYSGLINKSTYLFTENGEFKKR